MPSMMRLSDDNRRGKLFRQHFAMRQPPRFRIILPPVQFFLAGLLGGCGLWQRAVILSRPFMSGQTLNDTTARFHIWPWPFKLAAVINMPAVIVGGLLSWVFGAFGVLVNDFTGFIFSLLLVPPLWYWIGSKLDFKSRLGAYWFLLLFTLASAGCSSFSFGYTSYLPFGVILWIVAGMTIRRRKLSRPIAR
jgi:hypothetical protein